MPEELNVPLSWLANHFSGRFRLLFNSHNIFAGAGHDSPKNRGELGVTFKKNVAERKCIPITPKTGCVNRNTTLHRGHLSSRFCSELLY